MAGLNLAMSIKTDLEQAHRLVMQAAEGPAMGLLRGKGNRAELTESVRKLRLAVDIIEGIIGA